MNKIKKATIITMIIIFVIIFIVCTYIIVKNLLDYKEAISDNSKLIKEVVEIREENNANNDVSIDWEQLEKTNSDIIGWIKIDDTKIDYPIIQDKNLYYMDHTYEGKYNRNGSIFTKTNKPFETNETIIYGHNNKNGLMFAGIQNFMDKDFFYGHQTFKIYTKSATYDAKVFSIYSIGVNEESKNIKNLSFEECIEYYKNQSVHKCNNIDTAEKIVKLSTCSYLNNTATPTNQRYFLVAFLVKND